MTVMHPEVTKIIKEAQAQVRQLTGDNSIRLIPYCKEGTLLKFDHMCEIVCSVTGVEFKDAVRNMRYTRERRTRQLIAYYSYEYCRMSYKHIGELLGGRHHTTMMSSCTVIKDMIFTNDPVVCAYAVEINKRIAEVQK